MADLFAEAAKPDPLYEDQRSVLAELDARIAGGARRIVCQAPTAWGKTLLGSAIIQGAIERNERALWIVPAISLVDQTIGVFFRQGIRDIGVLQAQHQMTHWGMPVQVASVQTLMRRTAPPASVIIIDECHRWFAWYAKMMMGQEWAKVPVIGLSATPWSRGLGRYYTDGLIIAGTTQEMIDRGRLSDFKVFAPHTPDLRGVRTTGGDYAEIDLARVMNTNDLVADIVETWLARASGRSTLCFAVDRAHAKAIQQKFLDRGVPCGYQDAFTSDSERASIEQRFRDGRYQVVCNVGTLTTGVDWDVRCIVLARPTKSEILFTQIIGRGLRLGDGKDHCLILDHSSTHQRLGFVTDIHHDRLNDGQEKISAKPDPMKLPKVCPQCKFVKPPKTPLCPNCGFITQAQPGIRNIDGELIELTRRERAHQWRQDREANYLQLITLAKSKGKTWGWVRWHFEKLYGADTWPGYKTGQPKQEPSAHLLSWITSRNIAWSKRLRNTKQQAVPIANGLSIGGRG